MRQLDTSSYAAAVLWLQEGRLPKLHLHGPRIQGLGILCIAQVI